VQEAAITLRIGVVTTKAKKTAASELKDSFTFKSGTSLSKRYGLTKRFSLTLQNITERLGSEERYFLRNLFK